MASHKLLDPRAKPPIIIGDTYKSYRKKRNWSDYADEEVVDISHPNSTSKKLRKVATLDKATVLEACLALEGDEAHDALLRRRLEISIDERSVYQHPNVPGRLPRSCPTATADWLV
jgi:hypothetical protein